MTLRGQLTLAALLLGLCGVTAVGVRGCAETEDATPRVAEAPLPVPPEILMRLPVTREVLEEVIARSAPSDGGGTPRFTERVSAPPGHSSLKGPLLVDYTLDLELMERVFSILRHARVSLGHVLVLDPKTGRILAYASTDVERFPPEHVYPMASLIKIVTAAAALDRDAEVQNRPCHYVGSPYRLTRARVDPPKHHSKTASMRKALASSNNQCFAQLAVHTVGGDHLIEAIRRFGLLDAPARGHERGIAEPAEDAYDLGKLGSGLAGTWITPLHAAAVAGILAEGWWVEPRWIERVTDARGVELVLPKPRPSRQVLTPDLTSRLREMLVDTTLRGTARRAFRTRRGAPLLGPVRVAGKTGSLSGKNPTGRYEWFAGVAPADEPRVAVSVVLVQGSLWWRNASQVAAEVFRELFCQKRRDCKPDSVGRWLVRSREAKDLALRGG